MPCGHGIVLQLMHSEYSGSKSLLLTPTVHASAVQRAAFFVGVGK